MPAKLKASMARFARAALLGSVGVANNPALARAQTQTQTQTQTQAPLAAPSAAPGPTTPNGDAAPALLPMPDPAPRTAPAVSSPAGPFRQGAVRLTLLLGTGSTVRDEYLILGGGLGYYFIDGAEIGVDYEAWIFGTPVMHRVSPELRYVFHIVPTLKPYVGTFYRHSFIKDYDDPDYVGGRVGVYFAPPRGRVYIGVGIVYEHMLNCDSTGFIECDAIYPEISFGASL